MKKIKVGVLFGGQSQEHEISIISALSVIKALDSAKYEICPIAIDKKGEWHLFTLSEILAVSATPTDNPLQRLISSKSSALFETLKELDVIFPLLHGPLGEDGTVQGMLRLLNLPFVGCSHTSAAIAMDKDLTKRLLASWGIATARFLTLLDPSDYSFEEVEQILGIPCFIKPAHLGSSVGVACVQTAYEYQKALEEAFSYDTKVIIEERIEGRELECAVLGNEEPKASLAGEILLPQGHYYSYRLKYIESHQVSFALPAILNDFKMSELREVALRAYRAIGGEGMARVDFFLKADGTLLVNEINPIPGFTQISLFPKLWEITGLSYSDLLDELISLALRRHRRLTSLKAVVNPAHF